MSDTYDKTKARLYYFENKQKISEQRKVYYKKNKLKIDEYHRKYIKKTKQVECKAFDKDDPNILTIVF